MKKDSIIYDLNIIRKNKYFEDNLNLDGESFSDCDSYLYKVNSVEIKVEFNSSGNNVIMNGKVKVKMKSICCRCGEDIEFITEEEFSDIYSSYINEVDIKPVVCESIILSQPMKVLCNTKCDKKGE